MIKVNELSKIYHNGNNEYEVLKKISLEIHKGEFVSIMGSSGSGKSTLLNCISTVDNASSGEIFFENKKINSLNKDELADFRLENISFIFQSYNLLNTLNVYENIVLPLQVKGIRVKHKDKKIKDIVNKLGINDLLNKFPYHLSGGQQQRVAIARSIISETEVLIADEPTGALDRENSVLLMNLFQRLNEDFNTTIIMVTHDSEIASYSERVMFMVDGKIVDIISKIKEQSREAFLESIDLVHKQYRGR